MPEHPLGYALGDETFLRYLLMGDFKYNTVHSCVRGVQVDQGQMDQVRAACIRRVRVGA
jgi:hypothetical protein